MQPTAVTSMNTSEVKVCMMVRWNTEVERRFRGASKKHWQCITCSCIFAPLVENGSSGDSGCALYISWADRVKVKTLVEFHLTEKRGSRAHAQVGLISVATFLFSVHQSDRCI